MLKMMWSTLLLVIILSISLLLGNAQDACKSKRKVLWFMAVTSPNKELEAHYFQYVLAAINSARAFAPSLAPVLIHHNHSDDLPKAVRNFPGVHFLSHNLTFETELFAARDDYRALGVGPWYRFDIPYIIRHKLTHLNREEYDLDYVLYTDTDVLFFQDFNECSLPKPNVLYMGPESQHTTIANSGVMYMNVQAMYDSWPATLAYANSKKWTFNGPVDQGLYLEAYYKFATLLEDRFNWKGYWGVPVPGQKEVVVAHFHGPKPGGCLECYIIHKAEYKTQCKCFADYYGLLDGVPDNGLMYERMMSAFRNYTLPHPHL